MSRNRPAPTGPLHRLARILLVEDDAKLAGLVRRYLEDHGYQVDWAADGDEGARLADERAPDVVVLDLMLPGRDGLSLCREIRQRHGPDGPGIIILTARGDEADRVVGLELGADDYLTKPFGLPELLARVRAILRRLARPTAAAKATAGGGAAVRQLGPFRLDLERRALTRDGEPIPLTRSELDILELMTRTPGRVFERDELLARVRGGATDAYDRAVDTHVSNLRRKLGDDPRNPDYLVTVWGVGYRWGRE